MNQLCISHLTLSHFFFSLFKEFDDHLASCFTLSRSIPFTDQSLISFCQDTNYVSRDVRFVDISDISRTTSFERNGGGQLYLNNDDLKYSIHGTIPTDRVLDFHNKQYPSDTDISHIHIPCTHNFKSSDHSLCVINANATHTMEDNVCKDHVLDDNVISDCQKLITEMFVGGLASNFTFTEKKRASVSKSSSSTTPSNPRKTVSPSSNDTVCSTSTCTSSTSTTSTSSQRNKRKRLKKKLSSHARKKSNSYVCHPDVLPTISLGWTRSNCHEYGENKATTAGNVKPFLRDGGLSDASKKSLLNCVQRVLESLPFEQCFNVDLEDDKMICEMRKEMIAQFQEMLGGSAEYDGSFRVEGITITIPSAIGGHRDVMNCDRKGMKSVASVNVNIPINDETVPQDTELRRWLDENGFSGTFPVSIILYSRKVVGHYLQKMKDSLDLAGMDDIHALIHWLLTKRVGSEIDYQTSVWSNKRFAREFKKKAKMFKKSRFRGRLLTTTETLDKTVSCVDAFSNIICILPPSHISNIIV